MKNSSIALSAKLSNLLSEIEATKKPISIHYMLESVGIEGFGILLLFLSMPSALPIPAAGYSIPFGLGIAFLLMQMLQGRKAPWLPSKVNKMIIPMAFSIKMLKFSIRILSSIEHLVHPRLDFFCKNKLVYILLLILSFILILPIPLTNTAPAATIFLFSIGLIENDGVICLIAYLIGSLLIAIYCIAAYLLYKFGIDAMAALLHRLHGTL